MPAHLSYQGLIQARTDCRASLASLLTWPGILAEPLASPAVSHYNLPCYLIAKPQHCGLLPFYDVRWCCNAPWPPLARELISVVRFHCLCSHFWPWHTPNTPRQSSTTSFKFQNRTCTIMKRRIAPHPRLDTDISVFSDQ